jgi:hypothetical protein
LDGALIDHNRESETGMSLGFRHYELRRLVDAVVRTVPIDDDAIDAAADHIGDLAMDLGGIGGVVAHIHVI